MTATHLPDPSIAETRIGPTPFQWGARTYVMGILNVTPDSFSGDGILAATGDPVEAAVRQAREMVEHGADLLDIGGASTRPGHDPVDGATERGRVVPIVAAVRAALPGTPISVDTTKPEVAEAALAAGADLLNDVWAVASDDGIGAVAAAHGVPIVVMHNRAEARYTSLVAEVIADLMAAVERALATGIPIGNILVDPGFGFGKTADHNVALLHDLEALRVLQRPILLGTSRKSTLGRILDLPVDERLEATLATTALGIAAGVDMIRVHDVRANVRVARMSDAIVRGTWRGTADPSEGGPR